MTRVTTVKLAALSAMTGLLLLFGAFLITSSLAGAQTPEPTPQQQETPSAPSDGAPGT